MGGGDLNLKKSWHPSTLRNIERVWKAEQKHDAEQKKIEQLQRELAEERARQEMRQFAEDSGVLRKREEKLDWMYQGPAALLNREDYLTGRPIDKAFDILQHGPEGGNKIEEETIPESIFNSSSKTVTVDLANKIREDPLFFIRKQEDENKKQLLNNPVRMKQLQQLLRETMGEKIKKSKKHKKEHHVKSESRKSKKDKKNKHRSRSRSPDEKRRNKIESKNRSHKQSKRSSSSDSDDNRRQRDRSPLKKRKSEYSERRSSTKRRKSSSDSASSSDETRQDSRYSHRNNRPERSNNGDVRRPMPSSSQNRSANSSRKPRMSDEELERRRQEMLDNAKWRDQQRLKNVVRYVKEEDEELKEQNKKSGTGFIRPLLSKTAENITVEGRIKSNIYNIQRSSRAMESNFARRF